MSFWVSRAIIPIRRHTLVYSRQQVMDGRDHLGHESAALTSKRKAPRNQLIDEETPQHEQATKGDKNARLQHWMAEESRASHRQEEEDQGARENEKAGEN